MDYEKVIHAIIDSIVEDKDSIMIRELPNESSKDVTILIVAEKEDTSRLIGRLGIIANSIREVMSIGGKTNNVHIHLRFESFETGDMGEI